MWVSIACEALNRGQILELSYDGYYRCVEVHAVGYSKNDNALMRVWQVSGGSKSGSTGWKLLRLYEAVGAVISQTKSDAPRPGYRHGNAAMERILCQL